MTWLAAFLGSIIRPIIQEEFLALKKDLSDSLAQKKKFEKYDQEAAELQEDMANASTPEERYAILQRIKNARASINV